MISRITIPLGLLYRGQVKVLSTMSVALGGSSGQTNPTPQSLNMYFDGEGVDKYDLHNVATLVIRMFADSGEVSGTAWQTSSKYFWPVLYDNTFAYDIGMQVAGRYGDETTTSGVGENIATTHGIDKDLRTMIAYSAIDNGTDDIAARPFGDTGIRALYNDANDLGNVLTNYGSGTEQSHISSFITSELVEALSSLNSTTYISESPHLAQVFVEYAGDLAISQILQSETSTAINGVLKFNNVTADT